MHSLARLARLAPLAAIACALSAPAAARAATPTGYQSAVRAASPDVYWTLDDAAGSGSAADLSVHGRDGTASGVTFGQAPASTLATASSASFAAAGSVTGDAGAVQRTVELWVRPRVAKAQTLVRQGGVGGGWEIGLTAKRKLVLKSAAQTLDSKVTVPVGRWTMIDVAFKGNNKVEIVTNGGYTQSKQKSFATPSTDTTVLTLGAGALGGFDGRLDEVAVFPTVPADLKAFAKGHYDNAALPLNTALPQVIAPAAAVDGAALTVKPGSWNGAAGTPQYQWMRCDAEGCDDIAGATGTSYTASPADLGQTIAVEETVSNASGTSSATSAETGPITPLEPTISGTADEGQTLTAVPHTSTGAPVAFSYEWMRCGPDGMGCVKLGGATASQYVLQAADVTNRIRVVVATAGVTATSAATPVIAAAAAPTAAPANVSPPTVDGTTNPGQTLTAAPGLWTGLPAPAFGYEWLRCDPAGGNCQPTGVTGPSYDLSAGDLAHTIVVRVTATNASGAVTADSVPTAAVAEPTPPAGDSGTTPGDPGTVPGGSVTDPTSTPPGSGGAVVGSGSIGCVVRLLRVPRARGAKVRGLGRVKLVVKRAGGGRMRLVVKAGKANVARVAVKLDRKRLKGSKRALRRTVSLRGLKAGRHVLRVTVTPKRGTARTLKLALVLGGC